MASRVVEGLVAGLEVREDRLGGIRMAGGELVPRSALVIATRFVARSAVLDGLGLRPAHIRWGFGEHIVADATGLTEMPGVWVAGNVTYLLAQVVASAAQVAAVGAAVNADLIAQDTQRAVVAASPRPQMSTKESDQRAPIRRSREEPPPTSGY